MVNEFHLNTAVAFIIFNRPELTRTVFAEIRKARPPKLFVIADGPREDYPDDVLLCHRSRAVIDEVDWPCEVFRNYSDTNLGCGTRPATGISWVFEHVEEAIILEDDCVPQATFFRYCEELLEHYRDDRRIMMISGDNFQFGRQRTAGSYYFSRFAHCTGWASWRRAWHHFDHDLKLLPHVNSGDWFEAVLPDRYERRYWLARFQQAAAHKREIWDYHWTFAIWSQSALTIIPEVNLITNIGYNEQGTHTKSDNDLFAMIPSYPMQFPLVHPEFMIRHHVADRFTTDIAFIHSKFHALKYLVRRFLLRMEQKASATKPGDLTKHE
jgi:hypothetical protein